jgi:hypothetical protein
MGDQDETVLYRDYARMLRGIATQSNDGKNQEAVLRVAEEFERLARDFDAKRSA